jgi:RNA polymerase sigma-32 factor
MTKRPLLTPEQEKTFGARARAGDVEAQHRLVEGNLGLVVKIAREHARHGGAVDDLIQEGNEGLVRASRRFDPRREVKFSTYAAYWIRAYIYRWQMANARLVRIGTTTAQRRVFFKLRGAQARLGLAATDAELAREIGVSERALVETASRMQGRDAEIDDDTTAAPRSELAPDELAARRERALILRAETERFAAGLKGRDRDLFEQRWLAPDPTTLTGFAARRGISRERARQLEERLLGKLRERLEAHGMDAAALAA